MIFVVFFDFSYWNEMNKLELAMAIDAADLPRGLLHGSMHRRRHRAPVLPLVPCCPSSSSIDRDRTARRWLPIRSSSIASSRRLLSSSSTP